MSPNKHDARQWDCGLAFRRALRQSTEQVEIREGGRDTVSHPIPDGHRTGIEQLTAHSRKLRHQWTHAMYALSGCRKDPSNQNYANTGKHD